MDSAKISFFGEIHENQMTSLRDTLWEDDATYAENNKENGSSPFCFNKSIILSYPVAIALRESL